MMVAVRDKEHSLEEKNAHKGERKPWTLKEFGGQTVWDWLHLLSALAIPVVLAIVGLWFTAQQDARQQQTENQRAEAEREIATQRTQDETLQAYFDQMSMLLLEKNLRNSKEDSEVRILARARTLTVLRRLDKIRRDEIMQFLLEADLVHRVGESVPVIDLGRAYLVDVDLSGANLSRADLGGANLIDANLSGADLSGADLGGANLIHAVLSGAVLSGADLGGAFLNITDMSNADLSDANLSGADLTDATGLTDEQVAAAESLEGATMPNGQKYEEWLKDKKAQGKDEKNE